MRSTALILSSTFVASIAIAGGMGSVNQSRPSSWVTTLSAGSAWENGGATQSFYLSPDVEKTYTADKNNHILFDGEFFIGRQKQLTRLIQGQIGLALGGTSQASLSGSIWDDADPEFNNYMYSYKVQHSYAAVKGKLLADADLWLIPWVSGSVGVGFNYSYGFQNTPTIFEALINSNFTSHTQTSVTYTVGAGVQRAFNQHWQIGVGYEFSDWGKSRLGSAPEQTLNTGPRLNHLYTNGVLINITYIS